ncbi:hypothetical protein DIJ64_09125 [Mycobacterium leprae]|uniref:Uncharacterized protein n=1 Tax=Mycobacterium leprae TaxID=1769 RepID=A0AAD0KSP2_MYCLR|nr:hypothetical protein [Mycobacterium leprae]AWV48164.1 hypothetical protein DIJ64_09125 [Mycobacterium leprae]OAR19606.1 hypothetical protein A8144_13975 [Mycobacterium leprae 3125609]OAX70110.1 hypothetical protein A3216_13980 [Mycobacterium leprae 7935681]
MIVLALLMNWQFIRAELIGELPMIMISGRFTPAVRALSTHRHRPPSGHGIADSMKADAAMDMSIAA